MRAFPRITFAILLSSAATVVEARASAKPATPDAELFAQIEKGDLASVKRALDRGANVNAVADKHTPLLGALVMQNVDLVKLLLERGANPKLSPDPERIPIEVALNDQCPTTLPMLVQHGADINAEVLDGSTGEHVSVLDLVATRHVSESASEVACYRAIVALGGVRKQHLEEKLDVFALAFTESTPDHPVVDTVAGHYAFRLNGILLDEGDRKKTTCNRQRNYDDQRAIYGVQYESEIKTKILGNSCYVHIEIADQLPLVRRGANRVQVEFVPTTPGARYVLSLRTVTTATHKVLRTRGAKYEIGETTGSHLEQPQSGAGKLDQAVVLAYADDLPWHHYPTVTAVSPADRATIACNAPS